MLSIVDTLPNATSQYVLSENCSSVETQLTKVYLQNIQT